MNESTRLIAGVDEAGRGALAGPVVACSVTFKPTFNAHDILDDSKKLTEEKRYKIFNEIQSHIYLGTGIVSHRYINRTNILQATLVAMRKAINKMPIKIDHAIIDGNRIPRVDVSCAALIKADTTIPEVKAASICAKVIRDRLMIKYNRIYTRYAFDGHKGYGTKQHYESLHEHGHCAIHRVEFNLNTQLTLFN